MRTVHHAGGIVAKLITRWEVEFISIYDILGLRRQEATAMGRLRCADLQTRPTEVLDLTSRTIDEWQRLVPPFEGAFQAPMAAWRLDGPPRPARRYTTDQHWPRPRPADRLLFILVSLKTSPLQVGQGRRFGMGQSKAHQWMHVLFTVPQATRRTLGDTPSPSLAALATRLGMAEAAAAAIMPAQGPQPPTAPSASPLVATMARHGASGARRIRLNRRAVRAARTSAPRSTTCCGSMPRSCASGCVTPLRGAPTRS